MPEPKVSNNNEIVLYMNCAQCIREKPLDQSPQEYKRFDVGWTQKGFQVWCVRHDCNVMNIDFEGQQHPANTSRKEK